MNNWKMRLAQWMRGRYGIDALYKGLINIYFVLLIINMFVRSSVLFYLSLTILVVAMYRVFSRQLAKRRQENTKYLALRDPIKKKVLLAFNRIRFFRTHRYRTCPNCKTTLRLRKQAGTMTVTCPVCKTVFQVTMR